MPDGQLPLIDFLPASGSRIYMVAPAGLWWRILSEEGEVARYRTRDAALDGACSLADAMRKLGLESEVLIGEPMESTGRAA